MATQEIPREEWASFFYSFSRQHEGWIVTVEVRGSDPGAQVEMRELALQDISVDLKDGEGMVSIVVGRTPEEHVTHPIPAPAHVRLVQNEQGAHEAIEIESASGATTLIRFRSAMLPQMVDDLIA